MPLDSGDLPIGPCLNFLLVQCLADLKACKQSNIPVYSFAEHQRLDERKYLYGAAIIIGLQNCCLPWFRTYTFCLSGRHYGFT
jgi:hypothetical protein